MFEGIQNPRGLRLAGMAAIAALVAVGAYYATGALTDRSEASVMPSSVPVAEQSDPSAAPLDTVDPSKVVLATEDFPTTRDGLTYGSDAAAESMDEAPDLIGVAMDNGGLGFVRKVDLWSSPRSPEEAIAHENEISRNGGVEVLPAYDLAGNQIGTSSSKPSEVSYEPPRR